LLESEEPVLEPVEPELEPAPVDDPELTSAPGRLDSMPELVPELDPAPLPIPVLLPLLLSPREPELEPMDDEPVLLVLPAEPLVITSIRVAAFPLCEMVAVWPVFRSATVTWFPSTITIVLGSTDMVVSLRSSPRTVMFFPFLSTLTMVICWPELEELDWLLYVLLPVPIELPLCAPAELPVCELPVDAPERSDWLELPLWLP
jgi:hypothetical protein